MLTYLVGLLICGTVSILALWINPKPVVWMAYAFVDPILFSLPRIIYSSLPAVRARVGMKWIRTVERVGILIILVNAPGSLVLHDLGIQYDRFLHLIVGGLVLLATMLVISAMRGFGASRSKTLFISMALVFVGLFGFEALQFTSDRLFGTQLFHDEVQPIVRDVTEDLAFGTLGLSLTALVLSRSKRAWNRFDAFGV